MKLLSRWPIFRSYVAFGEDSHSRFSLYLDRNMKSCKHFRRNPVSVATRYHVVIIIVFLILNPKQLVDVANSNGFSWSSNWTCIFNATCVTWCIKRYRYQTSVWEENIQLGYNEPETPECRHPYQTIYSSSCNDGSGKGCSYLLEGPIVHFHFTSMIVGARVLLAAGFLSLLCVDLLPEIWVVFLQKTPWSLDAIGIRWFQYSSTEISFASCVLAVFWPFLTALYFWRSLRMFSPWKSDFWLLWFSLRSKKE